MVVIEHNLDVIKKRRLDTQTWARRRAGGGQVVAEGAPEQVAKTTKSYTGQYLSKCYSQTATSCMSANITTETLLQSGDRMGFIKNRLISVFIGLRL